MATSINACLQIWAEDLYLQLGKRKLYCSHQGNWHVTVQVCEGYSKVIYDGPNGELALQSLLGLCMDEPTLEVPADGPAVPSA